MLADAYRSGHARVARLVGPLSADRLATRVPACPAWSVSDLVAHLAGTAADVVGRRTAGMPGPDWTDAQVRARRGTPPDEVLAAWEEHVEPVIEAVEDRRVPTTVLHDLLVHEGDLIEALGAPQPPWDGWAGAASILVRQTVKGIRGRDSLVVRSGGTEWRSPDDPADHRCIVTVDFYELYRALNSRRSRQQMRRWDWQGDAEPWIAALPAFGPRDDEQPVPAPRV